MQTCLTKRTTKLLHTVHELNQSKEYSIFFYSLFYIHRTSQKKETKKMCICLLVVVHCKKEKSIAYGSHGIFLCPLSSALKRNNGTFCVVEICLMLTVLYPSRSCLYCRAISGTNGSYAKQEKHFESMREIAIYVRIWITQ